jgi:succinylglutamate desuccinylase
MKILFLLLFMPSILIAQERFKGQEPIKAVNTESKPITSQWKGVYRLGDIYVSNDFNGARVNAAELLDDSILKITILPENQPINQSPWYAFKIWSDSEKTVSIKLVYPENVKHRYDPKISSDSKVWSEKTGKAEKNEFHFTQTVSKKPILIASQPLITSSEVEQWIKQLKASTANSAGLTASGKSIPVIEIGNKESKHKIIVLGRQHPPEVTGHFALQHFVETLTSKNTRDFRKKYHVLVFPLLNPDGVDGGHWRHNQGGVDLNRDWSDFNQPETKAVRDYLKARLKPTDIVHFAIDFHSTHDDIYYTLDPKFKTNSPGLIDQWLTLLKSEIKDYDPNIKPLYFAPPTSTAYSYLYETYGAESLVFEIGDKTPEEFIKKKSQKSAKIITRLLLQKIEK